MKLLFTITLASLVLDALGPAVCRAQGCQPYWAAPTRPAGSLVDIRTYDNGDGPAIYASGFGAISHVAPDPVRRWDGHNWVPLGAGLAAQATEDGFQLFDDGAGPHLYFTGVLNNNAAFTWRWSGTQWLPPATGMYTFSYPIVRPEFSVPAGPAAGLYGSLSVTSNGPVYVVQWKGGLWERIGLVEVDFGEAGMIGAFRPMTVFDDGQGPELIVSGGFNQINGQRMRCVGRWNGHSWRPMGVGPQPAFAFATYDDGTGPSLYMGYDGSANHSALAREGVARWNGSEWVSVGGGTASLADNSPGGVRAMAVFDDGSGPALFVAGSFDHAGGVPAKQIAKWDGHHWSALGAGLFGAPQRLVVANDGRGDSLFIDAGGTVDVGGGTTLSIAQWVGCHARQCYADCDNNQQLNINDFICFMNKYAINDPYANCTVDAAITIADFQCFINKFAVGCP